MIDLSGRWEGRWQSATTGHEGPLRAQLVRQSPTEYQARFRGRFWKIIPFRYTVVLEVTEHAEDTVRLAGSSYLGRLFGTFHYQAEVTGDSFVAHYSSADDHGTFCLTRACR